MRAGWGLWVLLCVGCHGYEADAPPPDSGVDSGSPADVSVDSASPADVSVDSGSPADASASEVAPAPGCTALHGSTMVSLGDFCMDQYETTNEDYNKFLEAKAPNIVGCEWNTGFGAPEIDPVLAKRPRVNVDWCDAAAYCQWAGKRMCGEKGTGKGLAYVLYSLPEKSEWMYACSANGTQTYSYAGAYDEMKCVTGTIPKRDVGSSPDCHGASSPFDQIFDLSGNVSEWDGTCQSFPPLKDTYCRGRGGGNYDGEPSAHCAKGDAVGTAGSMYPGQGIRCCKTP